VYPTARLKQRLTLSHSDGEERPYHLLLNCWFQMSPRRAGIATYKLERTDNTLESARDY
jgi:hypothetical protein